MATGRLGAEDLAADTDTTLYQCPSETFAAISVNFCNRNNQPVLITLAVSATETPDPGDYVEYETELPARGTLERTGVVLAADQYLVIRSNSANVNAVAYGIESALVAPVSVPPSAPSPSPSPSPSPTYSLSAPSSVDENDILFVDVTTTNVSDDTTLYWTILDETTDGTDDFPDVNGSFTITGNEGTIQISIWADITTEGPETFRVQVRTGSTSGTVVATTNSITLNDTSVEQDPPFISISWTTISKPVGAATTDGFVNYVVAGTKIIAVPSTSNNRTLWESADGETFSLVTLPAASIEQRAAGIAKNKTSGRIVVIGQDLTASWVSTDDGDTWTAHDISSITKPTGFSTAYPPRIAFVNGVFKIVMGNALLETDPGISAYSADGITWTQGVLNPSIKADWFSVPAESSTQNEVLWGNGGPLDRYYYSDVSTPEGEVIVQSISPNIQFAPAGVKYASDFGWLTQARTKSYMLRETDIAAIDDDTSQRFTHNISGGGEAIGVLDYSETNRPSVVLVGPWTAGSTWRISYNLSDTWQNTTMPASMGGYDEIVAANGKFYVSQFNSNNIHVGTLSAPQPSLLWSFQSGTGIGEYSSDLGETWTEVNTGTYSSRFLLTDYDSNMLLMDGSTTARRSTDKGITWGNVTVPQGPNMSGFTNSWTNSVYNPDDNVMLVVPGGYKSGGGVYTIWSDDGGATWTQGGVLSNTDYEYHGHYTVTRGLAYGNGVYMIVPAGSAINEVLTITNADLVAGNAWTRQDNVLTNDFWESLAYGEILGTPYFFAATQQNTVGGGGSRFAYSSNNGVTWTESSTALPGGFLRPYLAVGRDRVVLVGQPNAFGETTSTGYYTDDLGDTWSSFTLPGSAFWQAVIYANGVFVAVGISGSSPNFTYYTAISDDGATWTSTTNLISRIGLLGFVSNTETVPTGLVLTGPANASYTAIDSGLFTITLDSSTQAQQVIDTLYQGQSVVGSPTTTVRMSIVRSAGGTIVIDYDGFYDASYVSYISGSTIRVGDWGGSEFTNITDFHSYAEMAGGSVSNIAISRIEIELIP